MNEIQIFRNEEFGEIRTVEINGQPYFVGTDVAKALGYTNPRKAIKDHVDEEDKRIFNLNTVTFCYGIQKRGNPNVTIINESGLYSLILSSKLETSRKFKHWVTSEVLPEIRHTGAYGTLSVEETFIKVLDERIENIVNKVLYEKIESIVNKAVSETVKVLSPFMSLPVIETTTEEKVIKKLYQYSSSKIFMSEDCGFYRGKYRH
ncbi:MAG: toxin Bro [Ruminococcus sp.]|nr:toxin Bro [Ruminococcus sp.]MDE6848673.1 toxin Bro [Ruminococcus sp.]